LPACLPASLLACLSAHTPALKIKKKQYYKISSNFVAKARKGIFENYPTNGRLTLRLVTHIKLKHNSMD